MIIACISDNIEELIKLVKKSSEIADQIGAEIHTILFKYYYKEDEIEILKSSLNTDRIILLSNILLMKYDSEAFSLALMDYYKKYKPDLFVFNSSLASKEMAVKLSSKLNIPAMLDVKELKILDKKLIVKRDFAGGVYEATYETDIPFILTLLDSETSYILKLDRKREFEEMVVNTNVSRVLIRQTKKLNPRINELKNAKVIISVGEALKDKNDLKYIFEIANFLKAEVSCTRFLSTRKRWFDEWIGVSGIRVSPKLYVGIGISGEPFHIAGILKSEKILAIVTDPESNIVNYADYIAICDLYKILPVLAKKVKKKYEKFLTES